MYVVCLFAQTFFHTFPVKHEPQALMVHPLKVLKLVCVNSGYTRDLGSPHLAEEAVPPIHPHCRVWLLAQVLLNEELLTSLNLDHTCKPSPPRSW